MSEYLRAIQNKRGLYTETILLWSLWKKHSPICSGWYFWSHFRLWAWSLWLQEPYITWWTSPGGCDRLTHCHSQCTVLLWSWRASYIQFTEFVYILRLVWMCCIISMNFGIFTDIDKRDMWLIMMPCCVVIDGELFVYVCVWVRVVCLCVCVVVCMHVFVCVCVRLYVSVHSRVSF